MKKYNILITDDDIDDYLILTSIFNNLHLDHEFIHLKDGEELISMLADMVNSSQALPDIIILDYNMPKLNGLEALKKIRKNSNLTTIPIIVYSTGDDMELKAILLNHGANSYVSKSSSIDKIVDFAIGVDSYLRGIKEIPGQDVKSITPEYLNINNRQAE